MEEDGITYDDDDARLQYLGHCLIRSLRIKSDKWIKLLATDEYRVSALLIIVVFKFV